MAERFDREDWKKIRALYEKDPYKYGLPKREYGSVVLASFNIRKLGMVKNRRQETWDFLADVCSHFDLLAVQEVMDDLSGYDELLRRMGGRFGGVVSDKTGAFPGAPGLGERLGYIFNWSLIKRGGVVSDVSYDRSKVLEVLAANRDEISGALKPYSDYLEKVKLWEDGGKKGKKPKKPKVKMPVFLTFIRQPFCVAFRIVGHPGTEPYEFMAINAHLFFGDYIDDRRQEFNALMDWITARVQEEGKSYYPNFVLLGDLNLDFDDPERDLENIKRRHPDLEHEEVKELAREMDREQAEEQIKTFNVKMEQVNVNFPFLDKHKGQSGVFRTNARLSETFDQIGFFSRDQRLPTYDQNEKMPLGPDGPDFGVFNFVDLFSDALNGKPYSALSKEEKAAFVKRFEHEVSDHLPLWLRLPLPGHE
jgi:endonuclease/exonuclease/phosphatase family metal-dependent hydrolase